MAERRPAIIDCDGHLVESIPEMAEYMDPRVQQVAVAPIRNRQSVFPTLDGFHYPGERGMESDLGRERVTASDHRTGSAEDWLELMEQLGMEHSVVYTTEGLSVGSIQVPDYAVRVCRAYNDYVADRYGAASSRLHPIALIPMQDAAAAVQELRRAVKDLGLVGAMLPSTGLPLDLGHEYYWPIYEEAANLDCVLGVHGGGNRGIGMDSFTDFEASMALHHPIPLMIALVSFTFHGLFDRLPNLRVALLEGGCGWLAGVLDRVERNEKYGKPNHQPLATYLSRGQILIGCEGEEPTLPYLIDRVGVEPFAYASDYPHEVDFLAAREEIEETLEHPALTEEQKVAVLGGNARRFFRF